MFHVEVTHPFHTHQDPSCIINVERIVHSRQLCDEGADSPCIAGLRSRSRPWEQGVE